MEFYRERETDRELSSIFSWFVLFLFVVVVCWFVLVYCLLVRTGSTSAFAIQCFLGGCHGCCCCFCHFNCHDNKRSELMCGLYSLYVSDNYCVNGPVFGRPVVYRFGCCFLLNIVGIYVWKIVYDLRYFSLQFRLPIGLQIRFIIENF